MRQENKLNQLKSDVEISEERLEAEKVKQDSKEQHRESDDKK